MLVRQCGSVLASLSVCHGQVPIRILEYFQEPAANRHESPVIPFLIASWCRGPCETLCVCEYFSLVMTFGAGLFVELVALLQEHSGLLEPTR